MVMIMSGHYSLNYFTVNSTFLCVPLLGDMDFALYLTGQCLVIQLFYGPYLVMCLTSPITLPAWFSYHDLTFSIIATLGFGG